MLKKYSLDFAHINFVATTKKLLSIVIVYFIDNNYSDVNTFLQLRKVLADIFINMDVENILTYFSHTNNSTLLTK